jgi:BirA family transcriptional regulator, biotin operon repressor / biotin---[acetyl-CoA-carboxylase] ligase
MQTNRESELLRILLQERSRRLEEITRLLGCQHGELDGYLNDFATSGFQFVYDEDWVTLLDEPEHLIPESILARLDPEINGIRIAVLKETTSTMDRIRQAGDGGEKVGLTLFAETQTAGRGRFGRQWTSASGAGLWYSILLPGTTPHGETETPMIQLMARAIMESLEGRLKAPITIKWPNDLLIQGAKIAGFLLECPAHGKFQILGTGINVRSAPEIPGYPTTYLDRYAAKPIHRATLAAAILNRFFKMINL